MRSRLRKSELDYEFNLGNETLRTQVFTKGSGMVPFDKLNLNVNEKGQIEKKVVNPDFDPKEAQRAAKAGGTYDVPYYLDSDLPNSKFKSYLQTEEAIKKTPELVDIYEQFSTEIDGMNHKEAYDFIEQKYNQKRAKLSMADAEYEIYGPKRQKAEKLSTIGYSTKNGTAALGNIRNKTILVHEPGQEPKEFGIQDFLDEYGITPEQFVNNTYVHGQVKSTNPLVASGEEFSYTNPEDGAGITFIASNKSQEDLKFKSPDYELARPAHNGLYDRSKSVYTGIPEIDQTYGRIHSRATDVYESDLLIERLQTNNDLTEDEREEIVDNLSKLQKNPKLDNYVERRVDLYQTDTGINLTQYEGLRLSDIAQLKTELQQYGKSEE